MHVIACDAGDLNRLADLILEPVDVFYHFAWSNTIGTGRNDMASQIDNIQHTIDAVHAAAQLKCKVFIGAGSQAEYGRVEGILHADTPCFPENGYGMAKLCAGQMSRTECKKMGLIHIWPRVLSIYGPGDGEATMISGTISKLLRGEEPKLTAGEQMWDYLYSKDAAEAFYLLGRSGQDGLIYPIGSGRARTLKSYVECLRDEIDPALSLGFGKVPYSPQQIMHLEADISNLIQDTGFTPHTDFKTGIASTIEWMKGNYHAD